MKYIVNNYSDRTLFARLCTYILHTYFSFSAFCVAQFFILHVVFCRSLSFLSFFFVSLYCLSFGLRLLITHFISSFFFKLRGFCGWNHMLVIFLQWDCCLSLLRVMSSTFIQGFNERLLFNTKWADIFSYISTRTNSQSVRSWRCSLWNDPLWVDMSLHSNTLSPFRANQFLFLLLNTVFLAEKQ